MKKIACFLAILTVLFVLTNREGVISRNSFSAGGTEKDITFEFSHKAISSKIIRFHVLANSDSEEDQKLKLKVRDKVLEYISPKLKNSKSIEESRNILMKNDKDIRILTNKIIRENGYNYAATTVLSEENFPVKSYGNITLPPGKYEAYRILIGKGRGQNWWCVMFPPLCFVDLSKGEVAEEETEKEMRKVLTAEEYNLINNKEKKKDIKIKFKILEYFDDIIDLFHGSKK